MRLQRELGNVLLRDPDIAGFASQTGSTGGNGNAQTANTARFFIALKPREQRTLTATQIIDRLRPQLAKVEGANLFLQATQDITVGGRSARASFQYTLQDPDIPELIEWSQKLLDKLRTLGELADVSTDLLANAPRLKVTINRDQAARFGITPQAIDDTLNDAYGQRQITQYFTQLNTYWIILEVAPESAGQLRLARPHLRQIAADRRAVPLSVLVEHRLEPGRAALSLASGAISCDHAVVQPEPRRRARPSGRCHRRGGAGDRPAGNGDRHVSGQRPGIPEFACERAGADRRGAHRGLYHSRHAL